MGWIKRNLFFVIGGVVALGLMGFAGYFLYQRWDLNNQNWTKLNEDTTELKRLADAKPHPGAGKINNIEEAKKETTEVKAFLAKTKVGFARIPPIPEVEKITDRDFSASLSRTIDQMRREATNSSVRIPPEFVFSFTAQRSKMNFAAGSLDRLATQLGEVRAICDVLFDAKVNSLESIRRERVSADDATGPATDYFAEKSVTNDLAILTPYEITLHCFTTELAALLNGFGASTHGMIVKTINVETAPAPAIVETSTPTPQPYFVQNPTPSPIMKGGKDGADAAFMRRYGLGPRGAPPPPPPPVITVPGVAPTARPGLQVALDERELRVTLVVVLIKMLPAKSS